MVMSEIEREPLKQPEVTLILALIQLNARGVTGGLAREVGQRVTWSLLLMGRPSVTAGE